MDLNFSVALARLHSAAARPLPGQEAHKKMVPPLRKLPTWKDAEAFNPKIAGVMALVYPIGDVPHLACIRRQEYPGVHSGQISLPGGKQDLADDDTWTTALRETKEEIGVPQKAITRISALTPLYIPVSNFYVKPYLGYVGERPEFVLQEAEVSQLLEFPLVDFLMIAELGRYPVPGHPGFEAPCFSIRNKIIWGATAMIIGELMYMLDKNPPAFR
jgi:8-oxo-dGTP pyrophosphatase MutT (NUDIX family)